MRSDRVLEVKFGADLRRIRRSLDLTQRDVARALGCTESTVCLIEKGKRDLRVIDVIRLARAMDLSPQQVMTHILRNVESDLT